MTYSTTRTCHDAGAGQARGDRVVADRVQQPAVAGPPQAEQDEQPRPGRTRAGCSAGTSSDRAASRASASDVRDARSRLDDLRAARRSARPSTTRPMPRVMISGWTRKTPTPMPLTRPASAGGDEGDDDRDGRAAWLCDERRDDERRPSTRPSPTDRSMPPVSIVRVWQPARIASGTAARMVTPTQAGLTMPGSTPARGRRRGARAGPSAG